MMYARPVGALLVALLAIGTPTLPAAAGDNSDLTATEVSQAISAVAPAEDVIQPQGQGDRLVADIGAGVVSIPADDSSKRVSLAAPGLPTIGIGLPSAAASQAQVPEVASDGTVVFASDSVDVAVQAVADGVRIQTVITDSSAPVVYEYPITLPARGRMVMADDKSVLILNARGAVVSQVEPAWAVDAAGTQVPTRYQIRGSVLIQTVAHRGASVDYPVVADPLVRQWWGMQLVMSNSQTDRVVKALAAGAGAAGLAAALAAGGVISSPGAIPSGIAAAGAAFGAAALDLCNWNNRGVTLNLAWTGQVWCWPR